MADTLPDFYQIQYATNWEIKIQQMESRLRGTVGSGTINGDRKKIDFLGPQDMQAKATRKGDTQISDYPTEARWAYANEYDLANDQDEFDRDNLGQLVSPESSLIASHAMAYNRQVDRTIIDALGATVMTGKDGTTPVAFPSSQIVAANFVRSGSAVNSGMTFAKVARARKLFQKKAVGLGKDSFALISADDEEDLVNDVLEIRNSDYTGPKPPAIEHGTVDGQYWFGFNWIVMPDGFLPVASNITNCFFYNRNYVDFLDGQRRAYIDIIPTKSHKVQIRTVTRQGAIRKQDDAVVMVKTYHA